MIHCMKFIIHHLSFTERLWRAALERHYSDFSLLYYYINNIIMLKMGCGVQTPDKAITDNDPLREIEEVNLKNTYLNHQNIKRVAIIGATHAGTVAATVLRNGSDHI